MSGVKPINSFPRSANKLASDPDKTTSIFQRFDRLSSRNLLFLEAKLAELEALQNKYDEDDLIAPDRMVIDCHSGWTKFERYGTERDEHGSPRNPGQAARLELALKIKEKLKEYRMSHSQRSVKIVG